MHGWQAGMAGETGKTWGGGEVGMKWKCWNECTMETERNGKTGKEIDRLMESQGKGKKKDENLQQEEGNKE